MVIIILLLHVKIKPLKTKHMSWSQLIELIKNHFFLFFMWSLCRIDFCYIEEIKKRSRGRCDENVEQRPCPSPRKGHSGRGQSLGLDLLSQPELVGSNPTVAFTKGLSFWINSVRPVLNQGFGATIRAINGMECNGGNSGAVNARIGYYRDYCRQLGVDPGPNLSC